MQDIYLLKSSNIHKEHSSAKLVIATSDTHALNVAIAGEILLDNMDYKGLRKDDGFMRFSEDVRNGAVDYGLIEYGYVETVECLSMEDKEELHDLYENTVDIFADVRPVINEESDECEL